MFLSHEIEHEKPQQSQLSRHKKPMRLTSGMLLGDKNMNITIDGRLVEIVPSDNNILDVADRVKIAIPCACYHAERSKGCCHACVVEIDKK